MNSTLLFAALLITVTLPAAGGSESRVTRSTVLTNCVQIANGGSVSLRSSGVGTAQVDDVETAISELLSSVSRLTPGRNWELCFDSETNSYPVAMNEIQIAPSANVIPPVGRRSQAVPALTSEPVTVTVDNATDSSEDPAACTGSTGRCNLRSAVSHCRSLMRTASTDCVILMPAESTVFISPSLGRLEIDGGNGALTINGNGCSIVMMPDKGLCQLLSVSATTDAFSLVVSNLTIDSFGSLSEAGGGLSCRNLTSVTVQSVLFLQGSAVNGGAIYIEGNDRVQILNCLFRNDTALEESSGGAIYSAATGQLIISDSQFEYNTAFVGGSIYLEAFNGNAIISGCSFTNDSAQSYGGSIVIHMYNDNVTISACAFTNTASKASSGGALFVSDWNQFAVITGCSFLNASAFDSGGAVYVQSNNHDMVISNCSFEASVAGDRGGAIAVLSYNDRMDIVGNNFVGTMSSAFGGSIALTLSNMELIISECVFVETYCSSSGGAIALEVSINDAIISNCTFLRTSAARGGAIFLDYNEENIEVINCTFVDTYSFSDLNSGGGSVYVNQGIDEFKLLDSTFIGSSSADSGGAVFIQESNINGTIEGNTFISTIAFWEGGALCSQQSNHNLRIERNAFIASAALGGGCIHFDSNHEIIDILDNLFADCYAQSRGGSIKANSAVNSISLMHNTFTGSSAENGGTIFIDYFNNFWEISNNKFVHSQSNGDGGVLYFAEQNTKTVIKENSFTNSSSGGDGGAIYFRSRNSNSEITRCNFNSSRANNGGAIYVGSSAKQLFITHSYFYECEARISGGSIYIGESSVIVMLLQSVFCESSAMTGGAIYIDKLNENIVISNCSFEDTLAYKFGGAVFLFSNNRKIVVNNSFFSRCIAREYGGAVTLWSDNLIVTINSTLFDSCRAIEGGAVFVGSAHREMLFVEVIFLSNSAEESGGAIIFQDRNHNSKMVGCFFDSNTAAHIGGAVSLVSTNQNFTVEQSVFRNNSAKSSGGALQSSQANSGIAIDNCTFIDNFAPFGGALYIGDNHDIIFISHSFFVSNEGDFGAGLYITQFNVDVSISGVIFDSNTAQNSGGGLYVLSNDLNMTMCQVKSNFAMASGAMYCSSATVVITECFFHDNTATIGTFGAVHFDTSDFVTLQATTFTGNDAGSGGAMGVMSCGYAELINCTFHSNSASDAGAIMLIMSSIRIENCSFIHNWARRHGAALYGAFADQLYVINSSFNDNTAATGSGSALYVASAGIMFVSGSSFAGNQAPQGGGAVFWEASSMFEPLNLSTVNYFFDSNSALYGSSYATDIYRLQLGEFNDYVVADYSAPVHPISAMVIDYYGQIVRSDSTHLVVAQVLTEAQCYESTGYVTGGFVQQLSNGEVNFTDLYVFCDPGYTMPVNLTCSLQSGLFLSSSFILSFRECSRGEYFSESVCVDCEQGTYSLTDPADVDSLASLGQHLCQPCPDGASTCYGDNIYLKKGYWRISDIATTLLRCPYGHRSCRGGEGTGNLLCADGYEGPLCAICSDGYAYRSVTGECEPCSDASRIDATTVVLICIASISLLLAGYMYLLTDCRSKVKNMDDLSILICSMLRLIQIDPTAPPGVVANAARVSIRRFKARLKIYITLWQIVSILPFALDMNFPHIYDAIAAVLNAFNLNISTSSLVTCSAGGNYDAIDALIVDTTYPVVVVTFIWLAYFCHSYLSPCRREYLSERYFNLFLIFTYLILPFTTARIFQVFSCQNVDPDDVNAGQDSYMTIDYSVSCSSTKYSFGLVWAIVSIILYPVGIPLCYFTVLYRARNFIMERNSTLDSESRLRERQLAPLHLLFENYEPHLWYWEIVETANRLLLTGVLVVIAQGSAGQVLVGIAVSLLFLKINEMYRPYTDLKLQTLRETCQWQIFFVFFVALLLKADFSSITTSTLDAFFVLAIIANFVIDLAETVWCKLYPSATNPSVDRDSELKAAIKEDIELAGGMASVDAADPFGRGRICSIGPASATQGGICSIGPASATQGADADWCSEACNEECAGKDEIATASPLHTD